MNFEEFDESNLFHIENSKIYRDLGDGNLNYWNIIRLWILFVNFIEKKLGWYYSESNNRIGNEF